MACSKPLIRLVTLLAISQACATVALSGEPPQRGMGLMAAVQDEQMDIIVPMWVTPNVTLAPAVRLVSVSDGYSDIGLGGIVRFYQRGQVVSPYVGIRGMALIFSPNGADGWTDILAGAAVGGDYFIDQHLSLGVEAQLNATFSSDASTRFGNPGGTNINSAMGAFVAVYF
jgi:hypothetical protein